MQLEEYIKMRDKGLAGMVKIANSYAISIQRYEPDGTLSGPELQAIGRENIDRIKADLQKQLDCVNEVESEMDALDAT